jgi:hypothetical protein
VLDFGLAKVIDAQRGAASASMLPTEAPAHGAPITAEGGILGTVAYMSPEQADGRTIDGRSDLTHLCARRQHRWFWLATVLHLDYGVHGKVRTRTFTSSHPDDSPADCSARHPRPRPFLTTTAEIDSERP